ncbi:hypothetical protein DCC85_14595 [Paenibacillus sp. CAA11]|nr:hypothetical protein DCC85_14595 [Paenibacillus sp. CAA11]
MRQWIKHYVQLYIVPLLCVLVILPITFPGHRELASQHFTLDQSPSELHKTIHFVPHGLKGAFPTLAVPVKPFYMGRRNEDCLWQAAALFLLSCIPILLKHLLLKPLKFRSTFVSAPYGLN